MMCTAAVYPLAPPSHVKVFVNEGASYGSHGDSPRSERRSPTDTAAIKWRPVLKTNDIASLVFRFSPTSPDLYPSAKSAPAQSDIISALPLEVSLLIFSLLTPQDLCHVCQVCKSWYTICCDKYLSQKRENFLSIKQAEYQKSKENYHNGTYSTHQSPQTSRSTPTTSILTPINTHTIHHRSRHAPSPSNAPPISPTYSHLRTPLVSFASVITEVERLSLLDSVESNDIRRCLFPTEIEAAAVRKSGPHPYSGRSPMTDMVIGRKSNRNRLRRL